AEKTDRHVSPGDGGVEDARGADDDGAGVDVERSGRIGRAGARERDGTEARLDDRASGVAADDRCGDEDAAAGRGGIEDEILTACENEGAAAFLDNGEGA